MSYEDASTILYRFSKLGTRAVTITGGGEPLCHPRINDIIRDCGRLGFEVGLVTNGVLLSNLYRDLPITWCRISVSGDHLLSTDAIATIRAMPQVDWAMSYVLQPHNYSSVSSAVMIANALDMSHIRIVDDILSKEESKISHVKQILSQHDMPQDHIIWQGRKSWTHGNPRCYAGLIKPNVDPHGNVYACCGVQYAQVKPAYNFPCELSMGNDYEAIWQEQRLHDGSVCDRCYYGQYNSLLGSMVDAGSVDHQVFI